MGATDINATYIKLLAGCYFDSYNREFIEDRLITVCQQRGIIIDVSPISREEGTILLQKDPNTIIDLRNQTVLPGFVDVHVHFFLHPYSETSWEDQLTRENIVERTVRAVTHAKRTLLAGFTTVRDLGTEGAGDADITLRKCLSGPTPLIPGPRYFCANRALVATGSYGPKGEHHLNVEGVEGITGAEVVDGKHECRKAVRRQIGAGADWVKIYADFRVRSRMGDVDPLTASRTLATFNREEIQEIISTATALGVKTAVHVDSNKTITRITSFGHQHYPHSLEHASEMSDVALEMLQLHGIFWVPTLAAFYTMDESGWNRARDTFQRALKIEGLKIACGGDTGVFAHGDNALELKLMVRSGAEPKQVLQWATLGGWECVRGLQWEGAEGESRLSQISRLEEGPKLTGDNDVPFGVIQKGFAADIIATSGDLIGDFEGAVHPDSISFVMKGGKIFKCNGQVLC